jgi:hypothetical protein
MRHSVLVRYGRFFTAISKVCFGVLAGCATLLALPRLASADYIPLNVNTSSGLVDAFAAANANPGNYYDVTLAPGVYLPATRLSLSQGTLVLNGDPGDPGMFVIDAQDQFTVLQAWGTSTNRPFLWARGITIRGGSGIDSLGIVGGGGVRAIYAVVYIDYSVIEDNRANLWGSGIFAQEAHLEVYRSLVQGNRNTQLGTCGGGATSSGGGIGVANADTYITGSTIRNNEACRGGGVVVGGSGLFRMENSTLGFNVGEARGGGLFIQGGTADLLLRFNTIAENKAGTGGGGEKRYGGGVAAWDFSGNTELNGNIIANNTVQFADPNLFWRGADCYWDGGSVIASTILYQTNIVGIVDNCSYFLGPESGYIGWSGAPVDPRLEPLGYYGVAGYAFEMPTYKPRADSLAVAGYWSAGWYNDYCSGGDQRDYVRPNAFSSPPICDVGAIEYGGYPW